MKIFVIIDMSARVLALFTNDTDQCNLLAGQAALHPVVLVSNLYSSTDCTREEIVFVNIPSTT